jgi:WD40 repeat protein
VSDDPTKQAREDGRAAELDVVAAPLGRAPLYDAATTSVRLLSADRLLTTGWDGHWRMWSRKTGELLRESALDFDMVDLLAADESGRHAVFGVQRSLEIVDLSTAEPLSSFSPENDGSPTHAAAFHPDGELLITGSQDKRLRVWDIASAACIDTLRGHRRAISAIHFVGAGPMFVASALDGEVRTWDLRTGECSHARWLTRRPITAMSSLDGDSTFAVGDAHGEVHIWNAGEDTVLARFPAHVGTIHDICRHGPVRFCTVAQDGELRVWSGDDTELLGWYDAGVVLHACASDGDIITVAREDGRLTQLALPPGRP